MQPEQQQRIMGYFIEEAKDHLNTIEQGLLNLQGTLDDAELANEVFRAAHSVKGGAAMLGLTGIQQTSHQLEDYFKILKETPGIRTDQKLETLLLRVFDTLSNLLEQLQTPFGLTEEVSQSALREANPVFAEVEQHLKHLMSASGSQSGQASTASRSMVFQEQVPAKLREMLDLFKKVDANPALRQSLQEVCGDLRNFGTTFALPNWTMLIDLASRAVIHPENSGRTLAVTVLKDLKDAQNQVLSDQDNAIQASDALMALVPLVAEPPDLLSEEDDFSTLFDGEGDLGLEGDFGLESGLDFAMDEDDSGNFDLFGASSLTEDFDHLLQENDGNGVFGASLENSAGLGNVGIESLDNFDGIGDLDEMDFGGFQTEDLGLDLFEAEETDIESIPEPSSTVSFDDLMLLEDSGPEMGLAELNSLADLFEGEVPDLSSTWQEEDELKETGASLDDLDLQVEPGIPDRNFPLDSMSDDALEDLFSDDRQDSPSLEMADDLGFDLLDEGLIPEVSQSASGLDDLGLGHLDGNDFEASDLNFENHDEEDLGLGELDLAELPEDLESADDSSSFSDLGDLFGQLDETDLPFNPSLDATREPIVEDPIEGLNLEDEDDSFSDLFTGDSAQSTDLSLDDRNDDQASNDFAGMEDIFGTDDFGADDSSPIGFEPSKSESLSLEDFDFDTELELETDVNNGISPLDDVFGSVADDALNSAVLVDEDYAEESPTLLDLTDPDAESDIFLGMEESLLLDSFENDTEMQFDPNLRFDSIDDPDNDWTLPGSELDHLISADTASIEELTNDDNFNFGDLDEDLSSGSLQLDQLLMDDPEAGAENSSEDLSLDVWDEPSESSGSSGGLEALFGAGAIAGLGGLGIAHAINSSSNDQSDAVASQSPERDVTDLSAMDSDLDSDLGLEGLDLETWGGDGFESGNLENLLENEDFWGDDASMDSGSPAVTEVPVSEGALSDPQTMDMSDLELMDLDILELDGSDLTENLVENLDDMNLADLESNLDDLDDNALDFTSFDGLETDAMDLDAMDLDSINFDEMPFEVSSEGAQVDDQSLSDLGFDEGDFADNTQDEDDFGNLDDLLGNTDPTQSLEDENPFSDLDNLLAFDSSSAVPMGIAGAAIGAGLVAGGAIAANRGEAQNSGSPVMDDPEFDDLEKLLEDRESGNVASQTTAGVTRSAPQARRQPVRASKGFGEQTMRVPVKHLDNLSNLVGELVVNRNSLEQDQERMRQSLDNLLYQVQQLSDVGQRMQDLYERSLLESSLLASRQSYRMAGSPAPRTAVEVEKTNDVEYDPLEMDRFTGFHSLSQEMIELIVRVRESASDIEFIVDETDQVTRMFRQVTTQLQEGLTRSRMVPFAQTADRMPRAVRDIAMKCGKQAELVIEGRETPIDKMLLEHLYDPMTHLVNNAITHGIETPEERRRAGKSETGRITIRAFYQGNQTVISVSDDGAGVDIEYVKQKAIQKGLISAAEAQTMGRLDVYDLLFHPGFSTRDQADDFAGRGVGMDVVRTSLSEIRGSVTTDSTVNRGTTFTIRLPLTLSISKALCCVSDRARIAFPMDGVEDMLDMPKERLLTNAEGEHCIRWRDTQLVLRPLTELLAHNRHLGRGNVYGGNQEEDMISVVVLRSAGNYLALQVDQVIGEQEIVIKQLEGPVPKPVGIAGATVLGDGRIMPIADVLELIDLSMGRIRRDAGSMWEQNQPPAQEAQPAKTEPMVLIVDDSITVRELLSMTFNKVGYRVEQARDGQEAWEKLRAGLPCNIVFCDIEMPRMDGLELLSRIQKDPVLKALPIAMLTSRGADRHRQMASSLGASGYFTKPYLEEALLDAAARMLKGEVLLISDRE